MSIFLPTTLFFYSPLSNSRLVERQVSFYSMLFTLLRFREVCFRLLKTSLSHPRLISVPSAFRILFLSPFCKVVSCFFLKSLRDLHRVSLSDNLTLCEVPCGANVTTSEPGGFGAGKIRGMMRLPLRNHPGEKIFLSSLIVLDVVWAFPRHGCGDG